MWKVLSICVFMVAICPHSLGRAHVALADDDQWWEYGHFYQIYPRSFKDADGNGVGDLQGIIQQLVYLNSIGVTGVWLSPIFKSPMKDFGYDISDFRDIDPTFGTLDDFDQLVAKCKELGVKLILDFVPNHSSDQHEWFKASADPTHADHEKYKDFYVWNEGKVLENGTRVPPSNWIQMFRGSAWEWVESRKAYYLHQFLAEQPDLNYRNKAVADEMKETLRYWLRKGVSGFRCDAVPYLFEVEKNAEGLYDDEPLSGECDDVEGSCYLKRIYTQHLDETLDMIYEWRKVVDEEEFSDHPRILMTEAYGNLVNNLRYYGRVKNGEVIEYGSHIPFNFDLMAASRGSKPGEYKLHVENWLHNMPRGKGVHANWVLGNHDNKRTASRFNPSRTDLMNILLKTLPGITVTYYGEELGMTDVFLTWEETVDPQACRTNPNDYDSVSRDPERTPMQWDSSANAGFSSAEKTWLPVAKNYTDCSVELQGLVEKTHLTTFRQLIELRENPTMKYGTININTVGNDVLLYIRQNIAQPGSDIVVVALNFGSESITVDLSASFSSLPEQLKVVTASIQSELAVGDLVNTKEVVLPPDVGLVLISQPAAP